MKTTEPGEGHLLPGLRGRPIPGDTPLKTQQLLTEEEYRAAREQYGERVFEADMGAEAVRKLLKRARPGDRCRDELRDGAGRDRLRSRRRRT